MDLAGNNVKGTRTPGTAWRRARRGSNGRSGRRAWITLWRTLPLCLLASCATGVPEADPGREGLVDRVWRVSDGAFVEQDELLNEAMASSHVLLGEVHINPYHHDAQTEFLAALIARGARPAIVFEMFHRDQQGAIDGLRDGLRPDAGQIAAATDFERRGWDWSFYAGLVELALAEDLPILAGNAPAEDSRTVVMKSFSALPASARTYPGLDKPLPPAAQAELVDTMVASHCGHAMGDLANRLVDAQRLRDASMAAAMAGAGDGRPASVLITGAGHARRDYGVPWYLDADGADILSIALVEVEPGVEDPSAYLDAIDGLPLPYDFLWFTPRIDREDPCEQFRKGLQRLEKKGSGGE